MTEWLTKDNLTTIGMIASIIAGLSTGIGAHSNFLHKKYFRKGPQYNAGICSGSDVSSYILQSGNPCH
jgi:hypothetical protein